MKKTQVARLLTYVTGMVNQQLLLENEYLIAKNPVLCNQVFILQQELLVHHPGNVRQQPRYLRFLHRNAPSYSCHVFNGFGLFGSSGSDWWERENAYGTRIVRDVEKGYRSAVPLSAIESIMSVEIIGEDPNIAALKSARNTKNMSQS